MGLKTISTKEAFVTQCEITAAPKEYNCTPDGCTKKRKSLNRSFVYDSQGSDSGRGLFLFSRKLSLWLIQKRSTTSPVGEAVKNKKLKQLQRWGCFAKKMTDKEIVKLIKFKSQL